MPLIEDADYNALVTRVREGDAARPSKQLLDLLAANPKTRRRALELIKEAAPNLSIPELDAAAPVMSEVQAAKDRVAALEKTIADDKAERAQAARESAVTRTIQENRQRLRSQGYQDEGIDAVEKLMQDRGLTDYDAAAALFERAQPKDEVVLPNYDRGWNGFSPADGDDNAKLLVANRNSHRQWQALEIQKILDEKRRGVLRA